MVYINQLIPFQQYHLTCGKQSADKLTYPVQQLADDHAFIVGTNKDGYPSYL